MDLYLGRPGQEELLAEAPRALARGVRARALAPGVVEAHGVVAERPVFCQQVLPDARPLAADTVGAWADALVDALLPALSDHAGPWRLHGLGADTHVTGRVPRRLALVADGLRARLARRQRRLLRAWCPDASAPWAADEVPVQLRLEGPEAGHLSIGAPGAAGVDPWPAGWLALPHDPRPPSRAFRKLWEAQIRFGVAVQAGQRVVDLGASPGGWSFVALEAGASVVAVDRSPLRQDLMAHPRLTFVQGDAFRHQPDAPVDWLLSDVIAYPERALELIARWLDRGWCRRLLVTVKFKGDPDLAVIEALRSTLAARAHTWALRQLAANKNEVTGYASGAEGGGI